ncbi:MAG: hypothetical protein KGO92_13535 [Bacteroidota bacterium]|nr:hypothetical protein [Bacteroidota bacterium]
MKTAGIFLIILGILMCIVTSINYTQTTKVAELGPLVINQKEHKSLAWPIYAGIGISLVGVAAVLMDKRKGS